MDSVKKSGAATVNALTLGRYKAVKESREEKRRQANAASILIESGVDLLTVSKRMGHSKISTTLDIYTHRLKKDDHEAADAMENVMKRKKK